MKNSIIALAMVLVAGTAAAQTANGGKLMTVDLQDISARVTTDAGVQNSTIRGQLGYRVQFGPSGPTSFALVSANVTGTTATTRRGPSGAWSVSLGSNPATTSQFDASNGVVRTNATLYLHYRLIDQVLGQRRIGVDDFAPYMEAFTSTLTVRLKRPINNESTSTTIDAGIRFQLAKPALGAIGTIEIDLRDIPAGLRTPLCLPGNTRVLPVQPVFVRSGPADANPTGRSLETLMAHAQTVWQKACVSFQVREPMFVDNAAFKILREAEAADLRATVDVADAVEVFFIETWDPIDTYGGGATWSSGTAAAKIITADNNIDQVPASVNNLAHELGHALTLCHPGTGCVAPRIDGSAGTVMEPSGFWADNPDVQSLFNCTHASNPLLFFSRAFCCYRPELQ